MERSRGLAISQVSDGHVQFAKTKSGKVRAVPISDELVIGLREHHKAHGGAQRVFGYAWSAFREGIERAGISLPDGQMTHSLRHVRQPLHDGWGQHPGAAEDPRTPESCDDDAVRTPGAGTPAGGKNIEPAGDFGKANPGKLSYAS